MSRIIRGNPRDNELHGTDSSDLIEGRGGNDLIWGHGGSDFLYGGEGADTFAFEDGDGVDRIEDFTQADGDTVVFHFDDAPLDPLFVGAAFDGMSITTDAGNVFTFTYEDINNGLANTRIDYEGEVLYLIGLSPDQLDGSNFLIG